MHTKTELTRKPHEVFKEIINKIKSTGLSPIASTFELSASRLLARLDQALLLFSTTSVPGSTHDAVRLAPVPPLQANRRRDSTRQRGVHIRNSIPPTMIMRDICRELLTILWN